MLKPKYKLLGVWFSHLACQRGDSPFCPSHLRYWL